MLKSKVIWLSDGTWVEFNYDEKETDDVKES